jgi:putative spermidine/putrescine transport system permease protein
LADRPARRALGGRRPSGALLGVVPFFAYVAVFLVVPTLVVVVGAFVGGKGGFTLANLRALGQPAVTSALWHSVVLSAVTALAGAVIGAFLAYAVSTGRPDGVLKKFVTSLCGVLAQFGGVALACAFLATFSATGYLTKVLTSAGLDSSGGLWLYEWDKGLMLVYLYFQIPLMLIVFLPAVEGLKPQWREATETLGGSTFLYWRKVAAPILMPSFIGGLLLLFTNAFSAYATAAALVSQGSPLLPLEIGGTFTSEVILGQENVGKAMALEMVVVVAVVMTAYVVLDRRASRWLVR